MKIIEGIQLKNTIKQIKEYQDYHNSITSLYSDIEQLNINSLQSFSFQTDNDFFDEVSFVLSVINSIIAHPHIVTKGEDIIIRAELAGHISQESFQKVFRESNLWKDKDLDMVPEYVYHYQQTDELKIYENIFIGMLIRILDQEISKYNQFYISLLPSVRQEHDIVLEDEKIENALLKIEKLQRKLGHIKHSYFFKEISKCDLTRKSIQPTNILLKDRLYNYCFKFYRKFIVYEDKESLARDFRTFYYNLILKTFCHHNFELDNKKEQSLENLYFKFKDFKVNLSYSYDNSKINLIINYKNYSAKHCLVLNTDRIAKINDFDDYVYNEYKTVDVITLWNLYNYFDIEKPIFSKTIDEEKMIAQWVLSKFESVIVKKEIYRKYCPVCRSKNIDINENYCICEDCSTEYIFKGIDDIQDVVWFVKIRRV